MTPQEREEDMVRRYGEVVKGSQAMKIIGCCRGKLNAMLEDGRLDWACAGTRVDVRSIARYICAPRKIDSEKRLEKMMRLRSCKYHV